MENACQSSRSISFPRGGWKGGCFTLLMQNEDSVIHRAFKPDLTSCSVWKCRSKRLWLLMVWQSGAAAVRAWCRGLWGRESLQQWLTWFWASLSDDLCSLLIRQTSQNAWWTPTPAFAPTGLWPLFAALVTSSRLSSLSCCLRDESESPSAASLPHLLPGSRSSGNGNRGQGGREELGQTKGLFSSPFSWEQMFNHSLLFAATGASLTINPFKSLVSLGDLCMWPGRCQSLGMLIAAARSVDCQTSVPYGSVACLC